MHIVSGQIQGQSQHQFQHSEQQVSLRQRLPDSSPPPPTPAKPLPVSTKPSALPSTNDVSIDDSGDLETSLLKALVEAMSGRRIDLLQIAQSAASAATTPSAPAAAESAPVDNARFLRVDATQIDEVEITQVAFSGQFNTADGSSISMNLQYSLQRHYSATTFSASIGPANPKDPLALNFDGLGVALDAGGTEFDIDSDNIVDALPTLRAGSAYLALDRNGDGVINNGSELFGAQSGNGYGELAQYDIDGNFFIDEVDPIFAQLQLFRPDESLQALSSTDVGAIFLGNIASPARLTDNNNQSLGQLRATGFYLTNSGNAGLVQQLDLMA
ncbi:MAG: hypothetical protein QM709_14970 [Spongiibacteraceae bacterium]